jgi:orotate phosphoribosyltransferase
MANLFQTGDFLLASGARSAWNIDCDALVPEDWAGLARIASEVLPPFGVVEGVPRGGLPFAEALRRHAAPGCPVLLIAEDVVTTGGSLERCRAGREALGVAVFCRGRCPGWVVPLFRMSHREAD